LTLTDFTEHEKENEKLVEEMLVLSKDYNGSILEEEKLTKEKRKKFNMSEN